ncbi:hypothetical protein BU25DRAFT_448372 [Macroventuria anomochaeta]|uniref:Uncharacterized protein n=1 Tax=Macroventuria anomochaeta TaxID=301207 RepID=A0ACB6S2M8_9PLEO|nr:uncharacterized protein BU25DRAFT_448372 [Macroventuria anomochaeta]KAF2627925.1 hypothetical protein BU25DRAFT_448372 [Macroventuria anomochaeta]
MSQEFQKFFAVDNTGLSRTPLSGTNVKPEHRIDYLMHTFIVQFMTGKNLKSLARLFALSMETRLRNASCVDGSEAYESLYDFIKVNIFHSSVTAMFGKQLFDIGPNMCDRFWNFEEGIPEVAKGLPRFIYPKQYKVRDVCLETFWKWQRDLDERRHLDPDTAHELAKKYFNDFFGSGIIKKRHSAFAKMEVMGADARASEDLALLWGANSKATRAAFWMKLSCVTLRLRSAFWQKSNKQDFPSVYAETLRLYVANIVLRSPRNADVPVGDWSIRQGEIVAIMSHSMYHDEAKFNTVVAWAACRIRWNTALSCYIAK